MAKARVTHYILALGTIIFHDCGMQRGFVRAQCLDSEALLKVSYDDPSWRGESKVQIMVNESSPKVGSSNIEEMENEYPSDAPFSFEVCIPRDDTCGHISVTGPPKGLLEISWDGELLTETGPELMATEYDDTLSLVIATQFGNGCIPECDSDEAVFAYEYRSYRVGERRSPKGYNLEDQDGNKIIAQDGMSTNGGDYTAAGLYVERMCLPKNDCYRLFMGHFYAEYGEHVSVSFDGKTLFENRALHYESMNFGDGCPGITSCDPNEESTVKFFMTTDTIRQRSPLSWELKSYNDISRKIIHRGVQDTNLNITLHYDEICVPKGSCMAFSLGSPEDDSTRYNSAMYMLNMDDSIYRKSLYFPDPSLPAYQNLDTTYLGDCAEVLTTNPICYTENETLIELSFHTIPGGDSRSPSPKYHTYWSVSEIRESQMEESRLYPILSAETFILNYEFDSSYRVLQCIPNKDCLYSLLVINGDFEAYSIKMNGELLTADTNILEFDGNEYEVTGLDNCSYVSGGTIAGIAIASVILAGALIALSIFVIRRKSTGTK